MPLHWPLINSDHMRTKLAKRELEKKKIEDAHRCSCPVPPLCAVLHVEGSPTVGHEPCQRHSIALASCTLQRETLRPA